MKNMFKLLILSFLIVTLPHLAIAQPDPGCDPLDPACPIDGGLSLLIAAGAGLGVKRLFKENKK